MGDRGAEAAVLGSIAELCLAEGRTDEALACAQASVAAARSLAGVRGVGTGLGRLAEVHRLRGERTACREALDEGERILRALGDRVSLGLLLQTRIRLALDEGRGDEVGPMLREVGALMRAVGAGPESQLGRGLAELGEPG
jgi:hypothetical protein